MKFYSYIYINIYIHFEYLEVYIKIIFSKIIQSYMENTYFKGFLKHKFPFITMLGNDNMCFQIKENELLCY